MIHHFTVMFQYAEALGVCVPALLEGWRASNKQKQTLQGCQEQLEMQDGGKKKEMIKKGIVDR